jgi:hypothetical protein
MLNKQLFTILSLILAVLVTNPAYAERSKTLGNYVVHYNALTTDFIKPKTANEYKIKRSKNRGMVTIAIQKKAEPNKAMGKAVTANVSGFAKNLNGQTRNLNFKLIKEGTAIYYIDDFSVTNQEVIDFVLKITPNGENKSYNLQFRQQFYTQ